MLTTQHLQHYVNEHFRSVADLTKLDELLPIETKHTTQLHTELCAVRKNTDTLVQELTQATRQSQVEIQRLRSLHETIRQIAVASPDTNPLWADQLLPRHQRLQSLYTVQAYLSTVARANQLGQQIKDEASRNPQRTVALYHQLHDMVFALRTTPNHPPYPNLDQFLDGHLGQVWESIRATLVKRYIECLNALEWPKPIKIPAPKSLGAKLDALQHAFADMLLLERPRGSTSSATHSPGPVLFAMQTLTRPLVVRFRYHFESPRPTNRLDKPEWFLSHVVNSIRDHYPFLEEELQPVLDHSRSHEYRVKDEFIRVWVQCVEEKLRQDRGRYLDEPLLLAHTVQQLVEFDHTLTEVYFYQPPPPILPNGETAPTDWDPMDWPGTVDVLLADQDLFDHWLNAEKEFAADQYNELILDENAWALLYDDLLDPNDPHPTQSAEALFQLVEGIGNRTRILPRVVQQMRFVADIQIPILEAYVQEIEREVQSLERSFFTMMKTAATDIAAKAQTTATGQFGTLVAHSGHDPHLVARFSQWSRWLHTCLYMAENLRDLAEQPFYLELWEALTSCKPAGEGSTLQDLLTAYLAAPPKDDEFFDAEEDSPDNSDHESLEEVDHTLFDELIVSFETLSRGITRSICRALVHDFTNQLRMYRKKQSWAVLRPKYVARVVREGILGGPGRSRTAAPISGNAADNNADDDDSGDDDQWDSDALLSVELADPLVNLNHALTFLSQNLPNTLFRQCYRDFARTLDDFFYDRVIDQHRFSFAGAIQLASDLISGLWPLANPWLARPANFYRRTKDALLILTLLPADSAPSDPYFSTARDQVLRYLQRQSPGDESGPGQTLPGLARLLLSSDKTRPFKQRQITALGIDTLELEDVTRLMRLRLDFPLDL